MNNVSQASIGTLELSNIGEEFLAEMSPGSVPLSNRIGFCDIQVWNNEGPIPHFHIISKNNINWECCIEIFNAKYFKHGSKQGTLTTKQLKILNDWLKEPCYDDGIRADSRWDMIKYFWKAQGNPMKFVRENSTQPDYTKTV